MTNARRVRSKDEESESMSLAMANFQRRRHFCEDPSDIEY